MPTIIDSLVVKFGLDSSEFVTGKGKVDKGLKDTSATVDKTSASFKNAAKSAAGFFALLGGTVAIKRFIEQTIESNAALDRLSKNLDANVAAVSAWGNAAELAGGSAGGLQSTLTMLSKAGTEFQLTGDSSLIPYFSALKIAFLDASGNVRAGTDWLLDLADRMQKMPRSKGNNILLAMGIDQGTANLLLSGRKEVELLIRRQKEQNAVTEKQAAESSRLRESIVNGRQAFEAFGRELLSSATPALEKLFAVFSGFGEWIRDNTEFVKNFLIVISAGLVAVGAATLPINLTAAAVLALSVAIAALWQDWQVWKRGGDSLIDWGKWEPGVTAAKSAIGWLRDALGDIVYRAIAAAGVLSAVFDKDWKRAKYAAGQFMKGSGKKYGDATPATATPAQTGDAQARLSELEKRYGLPAGLLDKVWATESGRGSNMNSPKGAQGHFQFMPPTAKQYGLKNPYDFNESSDAAARMYRDLLQANGGDVRKAAAAYNWGQGNLNKKGLSAAPTETLNYINKVTGGIPGASSAATGAGAVNAANLAGNRSVETHIGEIKVYSAATDAAGIAADVGKSMDYIFTSQANYGLY